MPRCRKFLLFALPMLLCIATTLITVGCSSICVSSNLGAALDSVGKSVPYAHKTANYTLNGKLYTECEVSYSEFRTPIVELNFGHLNYEATHQRNPQSRTRYLLASDSYEVIPASEFDYTRATRSVKPKSIGHGIPAHYCTHFRPLSADYNDSVFGTQVNFLPEQRSTGNYLRTPLVAVVSWGVDVPLTLVGNTVLYTATGFFSLLALPFAL